MISIQNITYNYPGSKHLVFKDFSLNLAPGRIYGLLGKNGTGKSTLLYLVCGLLRQRKGTVTLNGEPCALRKPDMLQDIYLVPEEYDLPNVSLKDYVRSNSVFYPRFSEATLNSCLADFELPTDIHLKSLSMGQKKKVLGKTAVREIEAAKITDCVARLCIEANIFLPDDVKSCIIKRKNEES